VFANARWKRGLGAKSRETERDGSVSGAPCETAVDGDGERWRAGVDEVVAAVRSCVRQHEGGRGGLGLKNRNRAVVAQFRAAFGLQDVERGAVGM
jgi:hypothetical protein